MTAEDDTTLALSRRLDARWISRDSKKVPDAYSRRYIHLEHVLDASEQDKPDR